MFTPLSDSPLIYYQWVLVPTKWYVEFALQVHSVKTVIASFVQLVEIVMRKFAPALFRSFGIYLPLITTNCAVMGAAILNIDMF